MLPPLHAADSVRVTPGERYGAGGMHRMFAGTHWRDVWTTPIDVEVLDVDAFAGGLDPVRLGGGMQTNSLRLMGADGILYKFRSIDKDPTRALDERLQETVVADMLQDQISVIHPMSAIIVQEMLVAADVLHATAKLCVMPDSPRLGEFQERFAGMLGVLEQHPSETEDGRIFAGADKIINGYKLFERLEEDNDEKVDAIEFLKARLMDILIGDRDRHADQWRWAGTKSGKDSWLWRPIPRDRDFAFPLYDGLIPQALTFAIISQVHFDYGIPPVFELTHSGRHLDRRFLGQVSKTQWDSVATFIQEVVTDSVLHAAVNTMPWQMNEICGEELFNKLQSRRDSLHVTADIFYELTNCYADFYGSDKDEFLLMDRVNDEQVRVEIYKRDGDKLAPKGPALHAKTYHVDTTREVRVFLFGGTDAVLVRGNVHESIRLVVDAGGGADLLVDSSYVHGHWLTVTPFSSARKLTKFYDEGKNTEVIAGPSTDFYDFKRPRSEDEILRNEPIIENRGHAFGVLPVLAFTSDDGLTIGIGGQVWRYDIFADPFDYTMYLTGAYSTKTEGYDFNFRGEFNQWIRNATLSLDVRATDLEIIRFYGLGNNTNFDAELSERDFYAVAQNLVHVRPELAVHFTDEFLLRSGVFVEWSEVQPLANTLADSLRPFGSGDLTTAGLKLGFQYDSRDLVHAAHKGVFLDVNARYASDLFSNPNEHLHLNFDARAYFTVEFPRQTTLALRGIGSKIWGDFPFFDAAQLGGKRTLRGFGRDRFAGDASLLGQAEIRTDVARSNIFVPFDFGLIGFVDSGRVFLDGENSSKWHSAVGGGIYASVLERAFVLSLAIGRSDERTRLYASANMMF